MRVTLVVAVIAGMVVVLVAASADGGPKVVPRMVGSELSEAECLLDDIGVEWSVDRRPAGDDPVSGCEDRAPDPKVVRQKPQPGTVLGQGEVVKLETTCLGKTCH
jgi:beta-lactam-binding protein with PASTA domain